MSYIHIPKVFNTRMIREVSIVFLSFYLSVCYAVPVSKTTSLHSAYPTINTPLGDVQGAILNSRQGKNIYAFRGITYAKPPVEELRFQPPEPIEKWEGVYNATQDGPACPQPFLEDTSESCLMLNVYTTKLPKGNDNPKRPVLVFFHGGDFTNNSGISSMLGPQYLLDQDIVLVTANYRLGIFGFLNTGDKEATGNFGLKDQVEVLKWVKANIGAFGGNSDSVTIAGSGSGAYSVTLHLVSALSKGLFHRAIVSSGSALGNIPLVNSQLDYAKKVAKHFNCADDTSTNIIKCLKEKSCKELAEIHEILNEVADDPYYTWMPTIEQDFGQTRFLNAHPTELISHGQLANVPVLVSLTNDEFGHRAFGIINNETLLQEFDKMFEKVAPIAFMYERETDNSKIISKALRTFYFGDGKIDNTSLPKFAELYSDALVGFSINRAVDLLAEKNNESVYFYKFDYKGKYSNFYLPERNGPSPYGVVNGDDLIYLFQSNSHPEFKENDAEATTLQKMITLWGNFIISGKPIPTVTDILDNIKWEPYTLKSKKYMEIGNKLVIQENLNEKRFAEWDKLFPLSKFMKTHSG